MQHPLKRPTTSSSAYLPNYTYITSPSPAFSRTSFQEESDTSRRVKFRYDDGVDPDDDDYDNTYPVEVEQGGYDGVDDGDHVHVQQGYGDYDDTTLSQPAYSRDQGYHHQDSYNHQQDEVYDGNVQCEGYAQQGEFMSDDNQYQYQYQYQYQHPQNDHQPIPFSQPHSQRSFDPPPSTSPSDFHRPMTLPLPQRRAKRYPIADIDMSVEDPEKYLNQEGGVSAHGSISGMLDRWNGVGSARADLGEEVEGDDHEVGGSTQVVGEGKKLPRVLVFHAPNNFNELAAAWYDPVKRKIEVLEDTKDTSSWDLAMLVLEQVQPDQIVVSTRTAQSLVDKITAWGITVPTRLVTMSWKHCGNHAAIAALASVRLPNQCSIIQSHSGHPLPSSASDNTNTTVQPPVADGGWENNDGQEYRLSLVKLGCWVNVYAPSAVIATGVLISQVRLLSLEDAATPGIGSQYFEINGLDSMELEQHMQINKDALTSLAIFDVEAHASMFTKTKKQALSVFGLLDTCVTPLGRKLFHTWHLRPLATLSHIEARHEAISMFTASQTFSVFDSLIKVLKRIKNVPYILHKMRAGTAKFYDWRKLIESLAAIIEVRGILIGLTWPRPLEILDRVDISHGWWYQTDVINWNESKAEGRLTINTGVNGEYDDLKQVYAKLDGLLNEVSYMIQGEIPPGIARDFNVIYFPQIGFHAVVTTENQTEPPVIPEWTIRFSTGDKHYFKNQNMTELDSHYGDIYVTMTGLEIELVQDLTEQIQKLEPVILAAIDVISELDCLLALSKAVNRFDLRRPRMTNDNSLKIKNGRHILYDQVCHTYVPNDILLEGGKGHDNHNMMIVTGANGSGKSAYGKQVALIVFMAQMGSFVPAEQAVIGICDKIFTRLQTKESSSKHASAFMIDLGQVSQALRGATEKSLVILDEFGKGTITWDGAGLLAGVIDYLQAGPCPKTVVLTHFHELITQRFLREDSGVIFAHMRTFMGTNNELLFLFKLAPGSSRTSYAAQCALQHNIPKDIVDRAEFVTECISKFEIHKIHNATLTPTQEAELKANEELARLFLSWQIDGEIQNVRDKVEEMLEDTDVDMIKERRYGSEQTEGDGMNEWAGDTRFARRDEESGFGNYGQGGHGGQVGGMEVDTAADAEVDELDSDNEVAYSDETD
uniref:DNA mismatch repair proteins mutS family domain-containing protein n=1 Tax=Kwoniella bestiolae CBS 10118 TaxID=1296100 RepID=A0A1B9G7M2_9TREE|nr:hypothetical protein I302_01864 [Kwoniella bestiolae CBS 10118]OCF27029.1 hypothetical protein I302_01864 [Kwoniella bestiolae CBS 10118]